VHVVVAPDSFKGTATASDVAAAVADGWRSVRPDDTVDLAPMADGGEGTLDAFASAIPGSIRMPVTVVGPDDRPVDTAWLQLPDGRAVVELANTSGIELLDPLRPDTAHTFGFGQAIAAALDAGATGLVVGIGGSASTDGGLGMLRALGLTVSPADAPLGGDGLDVVRSVDRSGLRALPSGGCTVVTDVVSPLLGPTGAAAVFGPQKGVTPDRVDVHDARLARWAGMFPDVDPTTPGVGAAGGAGFGLLAWGATLARGADAVADVIGLPARVAAADLVIVGEGRFDAQSEQGKAPTVVAALAGAAGVRTAVVAGIIEAPTDGFVGAVSLTDLAGSSSAAVAEPLRWARAAGEHLAHEAAAWPSA
jgi:glycerate 2-kinase